MRRSKNATRESGVRYAEPGSTSPNVVRCSRLKPGSTVISFWKLRSIRPAPDHEHDGERDFRHDESAPDAGARRPGRRALTAFLERDADDLLAKVQQRREPEDEAGDDGNREREREHFPVERDVERSWNAVGIRREQRAQRRRTRSRRPALRRSSESSTPSGEELPEQTPAAGAERGTDREFLLPRLGSREDQVREVRAGDQQDETRPLPAGPRAPRRRCRPCRS